MIIKRLQLQNFRNYDQALLNFQPGLNVFVGKNAQGKTNILESLVYLSLSRSHRLLDDQLLIRYGSNFADVKCELQDAKVQNLRAIIHHQGKSLFVNHQMVKKSTNFIGQLNVVLFSPDDLRIFLDAPKERRRLLDQEISKLDSSYVLALNQFKTVLKDRNALLKENQPDLTLLDLLDDQLVKVEQYIYNERIKFIQQLNQTLPKIYQYLSGNQAIVQVQYVSFQKDHSLQEAHRLAREKDLLYHSTTVGIHRDDLLFLMDDVPIIQKGSQGEKRMFMLAFKMSILKTIELLKGMKAVLLLDDVLSELDTTRQLQLLKFVASGYQCMMTTTTLPPYFQQVKPQLFHIENGMIQTAGGAYESR